MRWIFVDCKNKHDQELSIPAISATPTSVTTEAEINASVPGNSFADAIKKAAAVRITQQQTSVSGVGCLIRTNALYGQICIHCDRFLYILALRT